MLCSPALICIHVYVPSEKTSGGGEGAFLNRAVI